MRLSTVMMRLIFALSFVLAGCVPQSSDVDLAKGGNSCSNSADCEAGTLCLEEDGVKECVEADCITSSECGFQEYCTSDFSCVSGCETDADCMAGEQCDGNNTCQSYGCRSTELDCSIGEICNEPTGTCVQDSTPRCTLCSSDDIYYTPPSDGICLVDSYEGSCTINIFVEAQGCLSNEICFPDDVDAFIAASSTFDLTNFPGTCLMMSKSLYCTGASDCPRGFNCIPLAYSDGTTSDPVCVGDCGYFRDQGYY